MAAKRNYKKEYKNYHGSAKQRKRRSSRTLARRKLIKAGKAKKGDGKDVSHKNGNPMDNKKTNLKNTSRKKNRSYARTKRARKKNPKS